MALERAVGSVTIATTDTTKSVSGLGFQPKAILLWTASLSGSPAQSQDIRYAMGFGTADGGSPQQTYRTMKALDAASTADYAVGQGTSAIIKTFADTVPNPDMILTLASLDSGGFTLTVTDAPAANVEVHYIALGGSDITAARTGSFSLSTSTPQAVTINTGFGQPDLVMFSGAAQSDADAATSFAPWFGMAKSSSVRQATAFFGADGAGSMTLGGNNKASALFKLSAATTTDFDCDLDVKGNWPTDGFQLTKTTAPAAGRDVHYLALKGTFQSDIGTTTEPATDQTVTLSPGFTPLLAMFRGVNIPDTGGTPTNAGASLGGPSKGATDGTNQRFAETCDLAGATTVRAGSTQSAANSVQGVVPSVGNAAPTIAGSGSASFSGNTVPIVWTSVDGTQRLWSYLILGSGGSNTYTKAGAGVIGP